MFFSKIFALAALALAPIVSAQDTRLQFTSVPGPFTIGKPAEIKWTGGTGDSVTIILREGTDSKNLNTIGIIASNVKGTSYTWTPSAALVPGDAYALQITQGVDDTNYSGLFSIQKASGDTTTIYAVAGSSTRAVATLTPNVTSTVTLHSGSASGTGTALTRTNGTMTMATLSAPSTSTTATSTGASASSTGGAIPQATAQAFFSLGALAAAAVYLL